MSRPHAERSWKDVRPIATSCCIVLAVLLAACGGSTRRASTPHGKTTITGATMAPRVERLVVADRGSVSMVARGGCVATVKTAESEGGTYDELGVRCPKPERIKGWFEGAERVIATLALEPVREELEDVEDTKLPLAKLLTTSGKTLRVVRTDDIERLAASADRNLAVQAMAAGAAAVVAARRSAGLLSGVLVLGTSRGPRMSCSPALRLTGSSRRACPRTGSTCASSSRTSATGRCA